MIFFFSFFRCLEVSYIGYGPIHDILETWAINGRSSIVRALFWFPFSELTIMSYMNEASQRPQLVSLSEWNFCKEDFVGLKPSSSKLDVVLKCIAWPHWWSFEALFEGQWKSNHKDIFLELISVQKIYSQLTLVLKTWPMRSR